ncbi:MAG: hypothetical protein NTU91_01930 [Chloroflexi bacterium]|nr:hypothetical protein [Chloroflexota bacterium]
MSGLGTTIPEAIVALLSAACFIYVLSKLAQDKGAGHAVLGFLFPFYPFFWGWRNAGRLEMLDIMGFWTVITIFSMVFPALMADVSITSIRIR